MDEETKKIILYDGVCRFCHGMIRFILKRDHDGLFRFASLQSSTGQKMIEEKKNMKPGHDRIIFIDQDLYLEKSAAVLNILKHLGGIWRMLYFLVILPRPLRDLFYDLVARNRYRLFGKYDACPVPEPEWKERFLD